MGKIKNFLDYYRGRISYTEVRNMTMQEFQAFTYIMYIDSISTDEDDKNEKAGRAFTEMIEDELL